MKQTIITILLALVAMTGKAQIHYQIDGNTSTSTTIRQL